MKPHEAWEGLNQRQRVTTRRVPAALEPAEPRPHQKGAIGDISAKFKRLSGSRGTVVMACGTGKTLVGQRSAEDHTGINGHILVLVPSLNLLDQMYRVWSENTRTGFAAIAVCSDTGIGMVDQTGVKVDDLTLPATTDGQVLARFLRERISTPKVVFATYHSSPVIAEAHRYGVPTWDFLVSDEAHRTAGKAESAFSTCLIDDLIPAQKRLFLTATPRVRVGRGQGVEQQLLSMDRIELYGERIYTLPLSESIDRGLLSPYRVLVMVVTDTEAHKLALDNARISVRGSKIDATTAAKVIAMAQAAREHDLRRVLVFHNSVAASKRFARSVKPVMEAIPEDSRPGRRLRAAHMDSSTPPDERRTMIGMLNEPGDDAWTAISNVRIMSEGVDMPALDAVVFGEPRSSATEVTQIVGRAIRRNPERTEPSLIILPVYVAPGENPENVLKGSEFRHVWQAVNALAEHDDALAAELTRARYQTGAHPDGTVRRPKIPGLITVTGDAGMTDRFLAAFATQLINFTRSVPWWTFFEELKSYKKERGDCRVPDSWVTDSGLPLGNWCSVQRSSLKGKQGTWKVDLLNSVGFVWSMIDSREAKWEEKCRELERFVADHGHAKPGVRHGSLNAWVQNQKQRRDSHPRERYDRLEALGVFDGTSRRGVKDRVNVSQDEILDLKNQGFSISEIAAKFGISGNAIRKRLGLTPQ